jgi:hypothetical protein
MSHIIYSCFSWERIETDTMIINQSPSFDAASWNSSTNIVLSPILSHIYQHENELKHYFKIVVCPFVLFLLTIVCFFLRYADYDYLPLVSSNSSYWQYDAMSFLLLGCHLILLDRNRINFGLF